VGGQPLNLIPPEDVDSATLADLWHSVARLHQHRVAHRQLRTDNIAVDGSGRAWLTALVLAELGATDRQLASDVAELLASLAVRIGVDRTVTSAVTGLSAATAAAAAAYLQPLALSGPTRTTVRDYDHRRSVTLTRGMEKRRLRPGGRPSVYADLRTAVAQATGEPPVKPEPLARLTWQKALTLLGAFAVIYLLLPQLANAGAAVRALQHAHWWWVLAAVPALFVAQAFSTLLQLGTIPAHLPFGPTYVVSFGGSFLNRVTPNNVGGMALSFRYQQKAGVDSGAASGSVGLQTVIGLAANLLLLAVFFALTGRHTSVHLSFHVHQWVLVLITGAIVGCALFGLTPPGPPFLSRQDLVVHPLRRDRHRRRSQKPPPPGTHRGGSPRRADRTNCGALVVRVRPRRRPPLRPTRGRLPGRPPRGQRRPRARRPGRLGGRPGRRAVRTWNASGGRRIRGTHLPTAHLLVGHPRRMAQPQSRRRTRVRVTTGSRTIGTSPRLRSKNRDHARSAL
jgi:lysylphosphatidylglycerol synthase-like protein